MHLLEWHRFNRKGWHGQTEIVRSRGQKGRSIGRRRPGLGKAGYGVVRNQGTDKKLQAAQLSGV